MTTVRLQREDALVSIRLNPELPIDFRTSLGLSTEVSGVTVLVRKGTTDLLFLVYVESAAAPATLQRTMFCRAAPHLDMYNLHRTPYYPEI